MVTLVNTGPEMIVEGIGRVPKGESSWNTKQAGVILAAMPKYVTEKRKKRAKSKED